MTQHSQGEPVWVPTRDGRRLYAQLLPGPEPGCPTVVFEAGSGATRSSWSAVQHGVAPFTRAIVYDRAGLGHSEPDPESRTLDRMADDLCDVIDHFSRDNTGPFVLVGHSAGGPIVRLAAARRPAEVRGLVLVDPTDEAAEMLFSTPFRVGEKVFLDIGKVLARLGVLPLLFDKQIDAVPEQDVREDLRNEGFTVGVLETQERQALTFLDELEQWREHPPDLGDIPVTVISGGLAADGMPEFVRHQMNASHLTRATHCARGKYVIARESGHLIPMTEPELIVREIRSLIVTLPTR
ncbi:alpha/beta fold hydrolase [Mycolicibacterium brumae]|uniref:Alpha/beta hydrolase n=1 Tax=Mycolicibacterium brumae TaxID=85968 RepID=A0A2G5PA98_9MYCO|nr:alpha/beta hydrolase [Mycolicibacterium brumae]MCV7193961.1 alpha/beta hydrolase [Mycolicibacterium brumae]PIB74913.1 alpha/beta hydrolase [Mycolicibacterium brumae]RWA22462.1 hypothetical protein MBRU_12835 [Mycolicibacterium brumae DSM 44177]UWW08010.1 alpha/beta hydrolase [Mycolicibacterium brumae]